MFDAFDEFLPVVQVRFRARQVELLQNDLIERLFRELQRHLVDRRYIVGIDHRFRLDVRKQSDFFANLLRQRGLRAADQDIRLNADLQKRLDAVLGRLRFDLPGRLDVRDERDMDADGILPSLGEHELPHRLEKREPFDVADGPADLDDDDIVIIGRCKRFESSFDLVGDVRDHLDRGSEVIAAPLLRDHLEVDLAGCRVIFLSHVHAEKPLVMSEIEIGLRAVFRHVNLTVLEWVHRPGIHIEVRIELLDRDAQAPRLQQQPDRSRGNSFSEGRDHPARYKNVFNLISGQRSSFLVANSSRRDDSGREDELQTLLHRQIEHLHALSAREDQHSGCGVRRIENVNADHLSRVAVELDR